MSIWRLALILSHRYLGILLSLCFLLWFASGFVIIYTGGMPRMTEAERLSHLPAIDFNAVQISPAQALALSGASRFPTLTTVMNRPAYRFGSSQTVFADNGETLSLSQVSSQQIAADFLDASPSSLRRTGTIDQVDQWTIGLRSQLPLEKYTAQDGQGSELYVSRDRAEVVLHTTSKDRLLAWFGAIPHWFYFLPLRQNSQLWSQVVIWSASLATLMALLGLMLLGTQLRWRRLPYWREAVPYRGLMRWHYLGALVFGLFVITWAFSGLLSMEPYRWTRESGLSLDLESYRGGSLPRDGFQNFSAAEFQRLMAQEHGPAAIREVRFRRFRALEFVEVIFSDAQSTWQHDSLRLEAAPPFDPIVQLSSTDLVTYLQAATGAGVLSAALLDDYDAHYYGRQSRHGPAPPLPVLRVSFDDEAESVFYIDVYSGDPVFLSHRWNRLERWLYRGLHSLDFGAFYRARPLWDGVVLIILTGGLLVALLGAVLGFRRLWRGL